MALRVGSVGLGLEAGGLVSDWPWLAAAALPAAVGYWLGSDRAAGEWAQLCHQLVCVAVRQAINNRLRTGTDKGNPTV